MSKRQMFWSENHDVILLREILTLRPYQHPKGSKDSCGVWSAITDELNANREETFNVVVKGVRDHFNDLLSRRKPKIRDEERASGIEVADEKEIDILLEECRE